MDVLKTISHLIEQKGALGIMPNNLPEKEFEYIYALSSKFIEEDDDKSPDKYSVLALCVISILSQQQNYPEKIAIHPDDLMKNMHLYCVAMMLENMGRKTDAKTGPPTIHNIFDENRMVEVPGETFAKLKAKKAAS